MKRSVAKAAPIVAIMLFVITGCGASSSSDPATKGGTAEEPSVQQRSAGPDEPGETGGSIFASYTMNTLVNLASTGGLFSVKAIAPVRWNSKSGEAWTSRSASGPSPLNYRDVSLMALRPLFVSSMPLTTGDLVTVRLHGDGTDSGPSVSTVPGLQQNRADGDVKVGDTVLMLLGQEDFPMEEGSTVSVTSPVNGYQGVWTIAGDQAGSVDPQRTVALAPLEQRIAVERLRGPAQMLVEDGSERNPLSTVTPRPSSTPSPVPCFGQGCGQTSLE